MERQYAALPDSTERRIHILGTGNIGKLVAHSLRLLPDPPPVTLMFSRLKILSAWTKGPQAITVHRDGVDIKQSGFDVEAVPSVIRSHGQEFRTHSDDHSRFLLDHKSDEPIHNLIVTTKAHLVEAALLPIKHRLTKESTLCLLQNGMGVAELLNETIFPDPATRPTYIQGVLTHGANTPVEIALNDPFYVIHAGQGTMSLGVVADRTLSPPRSPAADAGEERDPFEISNSARYLLRTLTRSPVLSAVSFAPSDLFLLQIEKVAVNCCINTLTVLLDAPNGALLGNFSVKRTIRLMLAEISLVIQSLPEVQGWANINTRFSAARLEQLVDSIAGRTASNISSTLADVRYGKKTEIEFINGYIIKRGEELGIKCVVNYAMMQLVIGKARMTQREVHEQLPLHPNIKGGTE